MARNFDKHTLLASLTFVMLLCLIGIQFLFLVKSAKLEQTHFNHRVVLALSEARNEIAREANSNDHMHNYVCGKQCSSDLQYINFRKADSIISSNLAIHKIELDYKFEFINVEDGKERQLCVTCYEQSLNGLLAQNGIKLIIEFPSESKFLMAQVGTLFYLSIGAIIFVMISFIITSRLFQQKKLVLSNTKDFIDNMVHEFQTPIANIKLAASLIKKSTDQNISPDKITNYTNLIQDENRKMSDHVQDILRVAAMSTNKSQDEEVDLHILVQKCYNDYARTIEDKAGNIELNLNAHHSIIKGESEYLHHAICNILDNAIKYAKEKPQIKISTHNRKNKIHIAISDNGIGIAQKDFQSIFEKYFRVSDGNIHDTKGFGLGLDFVKNVLKKHNGDIQLNSKLNKGSTFTLSFKFIKTNERKS